MISNLKTRLFLPLVTALPLECLTSTVSVPVYEPAAVTLNTWVAIPLQAPVPPPSAKSSAVILTLVALYCDVSVFVLYTFSEYCLPFSVLSKSTNANLPLAWVLAVVVPVVPTVLVLLFKKVVSLIVNACISYVAVA